MTNVEGRLLLKNYRAFGWDNPGMLPIQGGFTALVGTNSSGKSTLLRSIFEVRQVLVAAIGRLQGNISGPPLLGVADPAEVPNDSDPGRFRLRIELARPRSPEKESVVEVSAIEFEYNCQDQVPNWVELLAAGADGSVLRRGPEQMGNPRQVGDGLVDFGGASAVFDYRRLRTLVLELSNSKYFPAFRNAINPNFA